MHDFRGKRGLFWVEMRYFPATSGVFGKEVQDFLRGRWYFRRDNAWFSLEKSYFPKETA